ncbi:hypothetical protein [Flavobacterium geliluteum]|uniref:Uncharacterized protein n=1 Tax=Flavobacterium geliluteum TaxID=2816120 RepID=A0A940XBM2_9FLAO|nr:hypothetical protein [Flavobacterium geliluteum]MBP4139642.1 hypothetical protein [Flavobacterium geliluteum]
MDFYDFLKDLNDTAKERLKTPITGAFIFSFLIYNWGPILLLLFSDASMEDKIAMINNVYFTIWAIIIPVVMAFFYTIIIPLIMIGVDWLLEPIKKIRIARIYTSKEFITDKKIDLAKKQFELKNVETGSKQIEDFQKQISNLTESNTQRETTDGNIIKGLNEKLKQSNDLLKSLSETIVENDLEVLKNNGVSLNYNEKVLSVRSLIMNRLSMNERFEFYQIGSMKSFFDHHTITKKNKEKYLALELIKIDSKGTISITNLGRQVIKELPAYIKHDTDK